MEPIEVDPLSTLIMDMYKAHSIMVNNPEVFTAAVSEPSYMSMDQQDKVNSEWNAKHTTAWDAKELCSEPGRTLTCSCRFAMTV